MLKSFSPVINAHSRILIIGSMPGEASLKAGQYYAHPRNQFWQIMFDCLENGRTPANYEDKLHTILSHKIGLWDSLAYCERSGSLDSAIRSATPNDFPSLFKQYPQVHSLLFNGQASAQHFKRAFGNFLDKQVYLLPSTSPAHAARTYEQKKIIWQKALFRALQENA